MGMGDFNTWCGVDNYTNSGQWDDPHTSCSSAPAFPRTQPEIRKRIENVISREFSQLVLAQLRQPNSSTGHGVYNA